jgi:hypothetical protein
MVSPHPPPLVDAGELRPRRLWYWVGGVIILIGIIGGVVGFVLGLVNAVKLPEFSARFNDGGQGTFQVDQSGQTARAGRAWQLYATTPMTNTEVAKVCTISGAGEASLGFPSYSHQVTSGGQTWNLVASIAIERPGRYTVSCRDGSGAEFAVAYGNSGGGFFASIVAVFAAGFGPPIAGILIGGLIMIVTGMRRGGHKRRLMAQRMMPPSYRAPTAH